MLPVSQILNNFIKKSNSLDQLHMRQLLQLQAEVTLGHCGGVAVSFSACSPQASLESLVPPHYSI